MRECLKAGLDLVPGNLADTNVHVANDLLEDLGGQVEVTVFALGAGVVDLDRHRALGALDLDLLATPFGFRAHIAVLLLVQRHNQRIVAFLGTARTRRAAFRGGHEPGRGASVLFRAFDQRRSRNRIRRQDEENNQESHKGNEGDALHAEQG